MIVVQYSASGEGVRFSQSCFCEMRYIYHWNLFLYKRFNVCFLYKRDEETGLLDVVRHLSIYMLSKITSS